MERLIIDTFDLEGMAIEEIDSAALLFGGGLGLDSTDALDLGVTLKKKYHIRIDPDSTDLMHHSASVQNLAVFIASQQEQAS